MKSFLRNLRGFERVERRGQGVKRRVNDKKCSAKANSKTGELRALGLRRQKQDNFIEKQKRLNFLQDSCRGRVSLSSLEAFFCKC